jgi:DNA ligase-1
MNTTGKEILAIFNQLSATNSPKEKQAILEANKDNDVLRWAFKTTLDPMRTHGVAKIKENPPQTGTVDLCNPEAIPYFEALDMMASRELTGHAAEAYIVAALSDLEPDSRMVWARVLLRDTRTSVGATIVNKVWPGLIVEFECMLAKPFEEKRVKSWPQAVEPKIDGWRAFAFVDLDARSVKFFTRSGKEYTQFTTIGNDLLAHVERTLETVKQGIHHKQQVLDTALMALLRGEPGQRGIVFDAEIFSGSYNETQKAAAKKSEEATDAVLHVFDILPKLAFHTGDGLYSAYSQRRHELEAFFLGNTSKRLAVNPVFWAHSHAQIKAYYQQFRDSGMEGAIVKNPTAVYQLKRSQDWMKVKNEETGDFLVVGAYEGEGKYVGMLGGLIVEVTPGGQTSECGGGFTDAQRKEFWEAYLSDKANIWDGGPEDQPEGHQFRDWQLLTRMVEIEYHELSKEGKLREPRFVRFRDDKAKPKALAAE